jgi:hypothetical protein
VPEAGVNRLTSFKWERKRFIGNDIVVIVFYEGQTPLDPNIFVSNFNRTLLP